MARLGLWMWDKVNHRCNAFVPTPELNLDVMWKWGRFTHWLKYLFWVL